MRTALPAIIAAAPFGALFGALAVKSGLSVFDAGLMSMTMYAGASQMVGLELFSNHIAPWLIVLSIFAVNFRHILYSAVTGRYLKHLRPWQRYMSFFVLTDPQFALMEHENDKGKRLTFAWLMGAGLTFWFVWLVLTIIGALFGSLIEDPRVWGLDFLLAIYFLGIVMGFRGRNNWLGIVIVSGVAAALAYKYIGSPWHVSIGAAAGIILAAVLAKPAESELAE